MFGNPNSPTHIYIYTKSKKSKVIPIFMLEKCIFQNFNPILNSGWDGYYITSISNGNAIASFCESKHRHFY